MDGKSLLIQFQRQIRTRRWWQRAREGRGNFFEPQARGRRRNDIQLFGKMIRGSFSSGRRRLSSATLLQRSYTTAPASISSLVFLFLARFLPECLLARETPRVRVIDNLSRDPRPRPIHPSSRGEDRYSYGTFARFCRHTFVFFFVFFSFLFSFFFFLFCQPELYDGTMKRINDRFTDQLTLTFAISDNGFLISCKMIFSQGGYLYLSTIIRKFCFISMETSCDLR